MEDRLEKYVQALEGALVKGTAHEVQLEEALESRDVMGQATGMLMDREGLHADEAFDMLRVISERFDLEVREVAALLVAGSWAQAHPGDDRDASSHTDPA